MSEHILIIEDDLDIANIERDYLMVAGYDVTIMTNGTDGIEAALNTPVDLIILDVFNLYEQFSCHLLPAFLYSLPASIVAFTTGLASEV